MLLHPTHFHSISIFLFSPLPISLIISHFLIRSSPRLQLSTTSITDHLVEHYGVLPLPHPHLASKTLTHIIISFPSSITFGLLGQAATVQLVSDSYNGIYLNGRRLIMRSRTAWIKLLRTFFWELLILLALWVIFAATLVSVLDALIPGNSGVSRKFWRVSAVDLNH
uniref:Uncharacterized protein n=1 Tax=Salix viminalis TaxID=40686 RepID=A0A6N2MLN5_SALVM